MFRSYSLQPVTAHDGPLDFEWDPETGELRGRNAALVASICRQAIKEGWVTGHPYPTEHVITDPQRHPSEMAVVLGQYWQLEGDLKAAYPTVADEPEVEGVN